MDLDEVATRLDRTSAQPLHAQIRDILHQQIRDHSLLPGDPVPTEEQLQRRFGVARSVVRQALTSLADSGMIHRQRGRGSVVATPAVLRRTVQRAGGLDEQTAARGQDLHTRVLELDEADAPSVAAAALGTTRTWRIERLRCIDDIPVAYMRTYVPLDLFPHFTTQLLEGASLLNLMRDAGHAPAGGPRHVQAVAANPDLAQRLGVEHGDPLLLLEGVTQDTTGQGLEWFSVWHRANTVFDVDARVIDSGTGFRADDVRRLRTLTREIDDTLAQLENQA